MNSYDSFGNPSNASFPTRYQFTGREFDSFSGLQYSRARFYDPQIGRFISEDPIGMNGGINQYAYVGNNPVNGTDPLGLYEMDVHYYLTYYLAKRNGCFSETDARTIAFGDQWVDDNDFTAPGIGKFGPNSEYHALSPGASPGTFSPNGGISQYSTPFQVGVNLHYYQDSYSHDGFPNPNIGHGAGFHYPDKTAEDVPRAVRMAQGTADELNKYSMAKCGCKGKPWDYDTAVAVTGFSRVGTYWPGAADIFGDTGPFGRWTFFADPGALGYKTGMLGIPQ